MSSPLRLACETVPIKLPSGQNNFATFLESPLRTVSVSVPASSELLYQDKNYFDDGILNWGILN